MALRKQQIGDTVYWVTHVQSDRDTTSEGNCLWYCEAQVCAPAMRRSFDSFPAWALPSLPTLRRWGLVQLVVCHLTLAVFCLQSVDAHWAVEIDNEEVTLLFGRADDVALNHIICQHWIAHLPWIRGSARIWETNDAFWNTYVLKFRWLRKSNLWGREAMKKYINTHVGWGVRHWNSFNVMVIFE